MDKEEHEKFMQSIKQQQRRSKEVMDRINETLSGVRSTITDIQDTTDKIDNMKNQFSQIMEKMAIRISASLSQSPFKRLPQNDTRPGPTIITMAQAVEAMMDHEEILFVTGAGVSVQSGIPTFRGVNGLYSTNFNVNGVEIQPQNFLTKMFYDKEPMAIWDWVADFHQLTSSAKPNKIHHLIHDCLTALHKKGKKPVLVSQNIDGLHIIPKNKQYEYHPIHGDLSLMRCSQMHMTPFSKQKINSKCEQCGEALRPHVMFFDQSYGVCFGNDVKNRTFDFVVVIGSSLNTGLCIKLVQSAVQIVEVNPGPVIEVGNVHPFLETEKALTEMMSQISNFVQ